MSDMAAVTIGVGPLWEELAAAAAEAVRRHTGLPVRTLGREEFRRSRLAIPTMLKAAVFDFLTDETLLVFDADLFFVRPWDPRRYAGRREIVCVRDFGYERHVREDTARFDIPADDYFNAGLFIVNRTHHHEMLEYAKRSMNEARSPLYEQGPERRPGQARNPRTVPGPAIQHPERRRLRPVARRAGGRRTRGRGGRQDDRVLPGGFAAPAGGVAVRRVRHGAARRQAVPAGGRRAVAARSNSAPTVRSAAVPTGNGSGSFVGATAGPPCCSPTGRP